MSLLSKIKSSAQKLITAVFNKTPVDNSDNLPLRIYSINQNLDINQTEKVDTLSVDFFTRNSGNLAPKLSKKIDGEDENEEHQLLKILVSARVQSPKDIIKTGWIESTYLHENLNISSQYLRTLISRMSKKYDIKCDKKYVGNIVYRRFILQNLDYVNFAQISRLKLSRSTPRARKDG